MSNTVVDALILLRFPIKAGPACIYKIFVKLFQPFKKLKKCSKQFLSFLYHFVSKYILLNFETQPHIVIKNCSFVGNIQNNKLLYLAF